MNPRRIYILADCCNVLGSLIAMMASLAFVAIGEETGNTNLMGWGGLFTAVLGVLLKFYQVRIEDKKSERDFQERTKSINESLANKEEKIKSLTDELSKIRQSDISKDNQIITLQGQVSTMTEIIKSHEVILKTNANQIRQNKKDIDSIVDSGQYPPVPTEDPCD